MPSHEVVNNLKIPTEMKISIASAQEAVRHWLTTQVLREDVKVDKVVFVDRDSVFKITFDRTIK